jgi:hypothetical protein
VTGKPEQFHSLGFAAIDWIEYYLVHGPGDIQGQLIDLDDEFATFVLKAYQVQPSAGEKIVRRAFLSRAKGRAKSELAGMLDCFEALGPCRFDHWGEAGEVSAWGYVYDEGEPVGAPLNYVEILNVATEEGQAGNTYDNAYYMLNPDTCSDALLEDYGRIDVGLTRISLPESRGFIEPVTASNESKDGGKSTFIVADETHLWLPPAKGKFKLGKMHQTMARNLLKRKVASGWMLETSTMYAEGEGSVAEGTHAYAESKAGRNGKLLFDHRQASDGYDLTKRSERVKALREAYGPAAAWMPLDDIADSYDDPQVDPREWERFWLNRPVPLVEDAPEVIFPNWGNLEGAVGKPTILGLSADVKFTRLHLGGSDGDSVGLVMPQAFTEPTISPAEVGKLLDEVERIGLAVAMQEKGPAWHLRPALEERGVEVITVTFEEYIAACGDFDARVTAGTVMHPGDPVLTAALADARWRILNRRRVLSHIDHDISALESTVLALFGANRPAEAPPAKPFFIY